MFYVSSFVNMGAYKICIIFAVHLWASKMNMQG